MQGQESIYSSPHCLLHQGNNASCVFRTIWMHLRLSLTTFRVTSNSKTYNYIQFQRFRDRFSVLPDFLKVVGLERGPLILEGKTEKLPE
jgi:hypothetical protein